MKTTRSRVAAMFGSWRTAVEACGRSGGALLFFLNIFCCAASGTQDGGKQRLFICQSSIEEYQCVCLLQ